MSKCNGSAGEARGRKGGAQRLDSRARLLEAAIDEFARNGLLGARVDVIARRAKINKQLIYHYFGGKEQLYVAVLEHVYADIRRKERALRLQDSDPLTAMRTLVGFTFDYVSQNRAFVRLLTNENILEAKYARRSKRIKETRSPLVALIEETLRRGAAAKIFRAGLDPVQLYISIAGLCFFYVANIHTLSVLFERDMAKRTALRERREHVVEFVLGYLTNSPLPKGEVDRAKRGRVRGYGLKVSAASPHPARQRAPTS
ncbi:MAG: TetR family transcriptional regulator, partial [Xanthobacteraceae bacterium]